MNNDYELVIGLEMHLQLNTKCKMFSNTLIRENSDPNTDISIFDIAYPGVLPTVNKEAVSKAIRMANALNMKIDNELLFDRKNYFYSDLSKGYQITQELRPLGKGGYVRIFENEKELCFELDSLHIEEDTCKQYHKDGYSYLDYNRSGVPLIEIVTKPDIHNAIEARRVAEKIRAIALYLDICDGKMQEGSMRFDVNISIKRKDSHVLGNKVEIKNLNSFFNLEKAVSYEIKHQQNLLNNGKQVISETKRFDEKTQKTVSMRIKMSSIDYKFFRETNIPNIKLTDDFINESINIGKKNLDDVLDMYLSNGLSYKQCQTLLNLAEIFNLYYELINRGADPIISYNWLVRDLVSIKSKCNKSIEELSVSLDNLLAFINLIKENKLTSNQGKEIFEKMILEQINPLLLSQGIVLIADSSKIKDWVDEVLKTNLSLREEYKKGKTNIVGYIMGQIMRLSRGNVEPNVAKEIIIKSLEE